MYLRYICYHKVIISVLNLLKFFIMNTNTTFCFSNSLIENLLATTGNTGIVIGKANTMYTAYSYNITDVADFDGKHQYYTVSCIFKKIVSKSLDKVKELYPNALINEALHGKLFTEKVVKSAPTGDTRCSTYNDPCDYFKFGKYTGKKFSEVDDRSYMCWYYNKLNWNDDKQALFQAQLSKRLEELDALCYAGCYFDEFTPEVALLKDIIDNYDSTSDERMPFEIDVRTNLDSDGVIPFTSNVVFQFFYTKGIYSPYGSMLLPCSGEDGKGKRIKGKKIRVTKYSVHNNMEDSNYAAFCFRENFDYTAYPKISTYEILIKEFEVIK